MASKKGFELGMQLVVIMVILLVVLIVVLVIFGAGAKDFITGTKNCAAKQGECITSSCPEESRISGAECPNPNEVCCAKLR